MFFMKRSEGSLRLVNPGARISWDQKKKPEQKNLQCHEKHHPSKRQEEHGKNHSHHQVFLHWIVLPAERVWAQQTSSAANDGAVSQRHRNRGVGTDSKPLDLPRA